MNTLRHFSVASILTLAACGAAHQQTAESGTSSISTTSQRTDAAVVDRLSTARCDQEQVCRNIGPGAKFASRDVCMDQLRGRIGNDLNTYDCPRGLDGAALHRCMTAIQGEECDHPFDTLTRFDRCRTSSICMN